MCFLHFISFEFNIIFIELQHLSNYSHKKQKDSLETRTVLLIFSLELEISGVAVQRRSWLDCISRSKCRVYAFLFDGRQNIFANITNRATYDQFCIYSSAKLSNVAYCHFIVILFITVILLSFSACKQISQFSN